MDLKNNTLSTKIYNSIIADLKKENAIYDKENETFEYLKKSTYIDEFGKIEKNTGMYKIKKSSLSQIINEAEDLYSNIYILSKNGIFLDSTYDFTEKAKELDCFDTYKNYYKIYPKELKKDNSYNPTISIWNSLVINDLIQNNDILRFEDYTRLYTRVYRLITLTELQSPEVVIEHELKLVAKGLLNIESFQNIYDKENIKDFSKEDEDFER